jgi:nitroreductase
VVNGVFLETESTTSQVELLENIMDRPADTRFHIQELLSRRWSPRAFADQPVEREKIQSLLEAARWASSCFNEQPWVFIVATTDHPAEHQKILSCLAEGNQIWAKRAPLLMLTVAKTHFDHNGQANRHAYHDVGLAVGNLVLQATAMDLAVHQMAGILPDKIRDCYSLPTGYEAVTGIAIGYQGDSKILPDPLREKELAPRFRKSLSEFVFSGSWGHSPEFL